MSGNEKYEPYLLGVEHNTNNLPAVKKRLDQLSLHSIGVEMAHFMVGKLSPQSDHSHFFWKGILDYAEDRKIPVVFLISDKFMRNLAKEARPFFKNGVFNPIYPPEIKDRYNEIVRVEMVDEMEQRAQERKPSLLMVGTKHAAVMRRDLGISKNKFILEWPGTREYRRKQVQIEVRAVRRYQRQKRGPRPSR